MIFVNPNGVLCHAVILFGKHIMTVINVVPEFDGHDVHGNIINENDWSWR